MNPRSQALETARASAGENPAGDRKQLLTLSIAAMVLVDVGLAMMVLDDKNLMSRPAAGLVQKGSAPGHVIGPGDHRKER